MFSSVGCKSIGTEYLFDESTIGSELYNNETSVIGYGGCGGTCLYKWTVNVKASKENSTASVQAISDVMGPEIICNSVPVNLNNWKFVDNITDCVSIEGDSKQYIMEFHSYHPTAEDPYCGCNPASDCAPWTINNPKVPDKLVIGLCENKPASELSALPVYDDEPDITRFFKVFNSSSGTTSYSWVKLYIDQNGWPIELPFPEDAFTNGAPDPNKDAYKKHAEMCAPTWSFMVVVFEDSNGKAWRRAGFYLEV
jgi:hypothetical protein